jgi:hypothetical protein
METNDNKLTFAVLAAVIASMTFAANGGIKPTFAQVPGMTPPPPSSSTDQGATSGDTSNTNMSSASSATNKTTVTRDTVTILLEGKSIPAKGFLHLYDSTI